MSPRPNCTPKPLPAAPGTAIVADPGGDSLFVVWDPTSVSADTPCLMSSRMRHFLTGLGQSAWLTVTQPAFLTGFLLRREAGLNETAGFPGDDACNWEFWTVRVRTSPRAACVRVRFGLVASNPALGAGDFRIAPTAPALAEAVSRAMRQRLV